MAKTKMMTKSGHAYRILKDKLLAGEFKPGERLTEARVGKMLEMGRTSVREALLKLEAKGLLKGRRAAYGGKYVSFIEDRNREDILHHYELREVVEGLAARLAAKNMNGWQIDELRKLERSVAETFKKQDREARLNAASDFHHYLVANCGNPLLLQVWEVHYLMPFTPRSPASEEKIFANFPKAVRHGEELKPVVDSIAAHDPDEAERQMREAIRRITEAIRKTAWPVPEPGF